MEIKTIKEELNKSKKSLKNVNKEFIDSFIKDPIKALSWSQGVFELISKEMVITEVLTALHFIENPESNVTMESYRNYILTTILNKSKSIELSTSVTSNLISRYRLKSYAEIYDNYLKKDAVGF